MSQSCSTTTAALVTTFLDATRNVLATMAGIDVQLGAPHEKEEPETTYDVSAIVGFSGDVAGSVVVSFSRGTALAIVEAFAGIALDVDDLDFADAVGELGNMIAGNAKKEFGCNASISVPSVVIGTGHTVARLRDVPCMIIPGACAAGQFAVEVNIRTTV